MRAVGEALTMLAGRVAEALRVGAVFPVGLGRTALWAALKTLRAEGHCVAVPDFICRQVLDAIRAAGAAPVFYRVGADLRIDPESFVTALRRGCRVALLVDYFGQVGEEIPGLAERARTCGAAVIEDAALAWGASLNGRLAGSFGDLAIFSLTKTGWNYGGGVAVTCREDLREALARLEHALPLDGRRLLLYGALRRLDFAANRVRGGRFLAACGWLAQHVLLPGKRDFYEAAPVTLAMPDFAARRALRWMAEEPQRVARRRAALARLLQEPAIAEALLRPAGGPGDNGAFLLLRSQNSQAALWRQRAATRGVTLRLCWPAYQELEPEQFCATLARLAQEVAILEIHPDWTPDEIDHIACVLSGLIRHAGRG
jgi:dTDP-4-amino-4,6-dideoxygalactose transaminase